MSSIAEISLERQRTEERLAECARMYMATTEAQQDLHRRLLELTAERNSYLVRMQKMEQVIEVLVRQDADSIISALRSWLASDEVEIGAAIMSFIKSAGVR